MSPLRLNGSTSGNVTLDAPAVAGNNTLVLPGGNGNAQQVLAGNGSGVLSWSNRPILQVVSASLATQYSTTSTTYSDVGLSASITPTSTSNKVLVLVQLGCRTVNSGNTTYNESLGAWNLVRGSTIIQEKQIGMNIAVGANYSKETQSMMNFMELDSPATTSSITYKVQSKVGSSAFAAVTCYNDLYGTTIPQANAKSTITLLEVAA